MEPHEARAHTLDDFAEMIEMLGSDEEEVETARQMYGSVIDRYMEYRQLDDPEEVENMKFGFMNG